MIELNKDMSFEQAYEALKETVEALESPNNTIDESVELYEKACALVLFCQRKLNDAKSRVIDINERIRELKADDAFEDEG